MNMGLAIAFGVILGLLVLDNVGIGIAIGIAIGAALTAFDNRRNSSDQL